MALNHVSSPARSVFSAVFAACIVLGLSVTPAAANAFPNNADSTVADGAVHNYCETPSLSTEEQKQVVEYAMFWLDSTTDMSDSPQLNCANSTDVWWFRTDLGEDIRGLRVCQVKAGGVCDSSDVHLNFVELDEGPNDWWDRRKTSTHELGHSVGLGHDNISCMIQGEIPALNEQWLRYSPHDISHINAFY